MAKRDEGRSVVALGPLMQRRERGQRLGTQEERDSAVTAELGQAELVQHGLGVELLRRAVFAHLAGLEPPGHITAKGGLRAGGGRHVTDGDVLSLRSSLPRSKRCLLFRRGCSSSSE